MLKLDAGGLLCSVLVYACVLYADFALIAHVIVPFVHVGLGIFLSIGNYNIFFGKKLKNLNFALQCRV